jgi:hypothetical protein
MSNISSITINKRANDQFKKLTVIEDGAKGPTEYEVRADALSAKIARLKALRLARDAAIRAAPPPAPVKKKAGKTKKRPAPSPAVSLLDWRKNHQTKNYQARSMREGSNGPSDPRRHPRRHLPLRSRNHPD